jgi:hypothetical protein
MRLRMLHGGRDDPLRIFEAKVRFAFHGPHCATIRMSGPNARS